MPLALEGSTRADSGDGLDGILVISYMMRLDQIFSGLPYPGPEIYLYWTMHANEGRAVAPPWVPSYESYCGDAIISRAADSMRTGSRWRTFSGAS